MGDLITQISAMSAAESSARAAREAEGARNAAEERLETSGHNPFIVFTVLKLESVPQRGFFSLSKKKVSSKTTKLSIKRSDISYLSEAEDDFGGKYTVINLEERCDLNESEIKVAGTIEENERYINSK